MLSKIKDIIDSNTQDEILYKKWDTNHRDEFFTKIYWNYSPMTSKYFFEGNPAFLYEYKNLFDMGRYPITMVRDGFLGILDFFLVHPVPNKDYRSIVLIPKMFEALIPKLWVEQVALYEIELQESINVQSSNEDLVLFGFSAEEIFLEETIEQKVKSFKDKAKGYKRVHFIFPQRESLLTHPSEKDRSKYCLDLYKYIYKYFGFDAVIYQDLGKFLKNNKLKKFDYLKLDSSKIFIYDDYMDHFFINSGGLPLDINPAQPAQDKLVYNLSLKHRISISDFNSEKSKFNEFYVSHRVQRRTSSIYELFNYAEVREKYLDIFSLKS